MNYLSHHTVARSFVAQKPEFDIPAFFVGNVLPDLMAVSGEGRLRARSVQTPPDDADPFLVNGIHLHLATDTRFHGHPLFAETTAEAGIALRTMPFSVPLRRVFFLAHAFVEIALDGCLIRQDGGIADDFYAQFALTNLNAVVTNTQKLLGSDTLFGLSYTVQRFVEARYLLSYARESGMAEALHRVCHRAKLGDLFADTVDRALLANCFRAFLPQISAKAAALLTPPDTITVIQ